MPRKRLQGGEAITDRTDVQPCQGCRLPPVEKKVHWFYSFSSTDKLFAHLAKEGIRTSEEYRRDIAAWYAECEDVVATLDSDRARYAETADNLRRWSFQVALARTPDEVDRLADELLSSRAAEAVKVWTRVWRKSSGRISRSELDEAVAGSLRGAA